MSIEEDEKQFKRMTKKMDPGYNMLSRTHLIQILLFSYLLHTYVPGLGCNENMFLVVFCAVCVSTSLKTAYCDMWPKRYC